MPRHPVLACLALLLASCLSAAFVHAAPARNLFRELLGKSEAETTARIDAAWRQLTTGDEKNERLYFPAPNDTAYIADIGNGDVRSEGMSYGLMIAVQLNRQDEFNRLWKWAHTHMRHASGPRAGYFAWQCAFDGRDIGNGVSASDGEEWIVTALFFAAHRWGDGEGIFAYSREAQSLLREMLHKPKSGEWTAIFDRDAKQVTFCPIGRAATMTDPSYHLPHFYELWARWAEDAEDRKFWAEAADVSRAFFKKNAHPETGLMSEYAHFDGRPYSEKHFGAGKDEFGFDAWRTLSHVALDHAWGSGDAWQRERTDRALRFLGAQGNKLVNRYTLDGRPLTNYSSPGLVAMAAAAGVASDPALARPFVKRLWDAPMPTGKWRYYDGLLTMLGLLQTSGRFQVFDAPAARSETSSAAGKNRRPRRSSRSASAESDVAAAALVTGAGKASAASANSAAPAEVAFDSFRYVGRDETAPGMTPAALPAGHYRNPILAGFFPDPSVCRVGDDYYLVNSTFAYFPGLPIFHSRDLVNWRLIGHAIARPDQLDYRGIGVSRGLFAPAIEHRDGVFYLVCTMIGGRGNFVVTATNPAGPWSDPAWLDFGGIDPSLFFDDDGRAWLVHNGEAPDNKPLYDGHRAVWLREFDPVAKRVVGSPRLLVNGGVSLAQKPVWIEGPHLYKRDGWYYLTCAEGGTGTAHSQVVFRSRAVTGPFEPWGDNPILTQRDLDGAAPGSVTCTGHADLVEGPDGRWWSVFLGCRPYSEGRYFTTGRETFLLPVDWPAGGWPRILPPGKRVPLVAVGPTLAAPAAGVAPLTGDFDWTDEFTRAALDPFWIMLRAPTDAPMWRIDYTKGGRLLLASRAESLAGDQHPAFLARRVQHAKFGAFVRFAELPKTENVSAGLAFFQSEKNHYFFAVRREAGGVFLVLELADGAAPREIAREPLPADWRSVSLSIQADGDRLSFAYVQNPRGEKWRTFGGDAEFSTRPVTVAAAGGGIHFTGAVVGPHVRSD